MEEVTTFYLDSNALIHAAGDGGSLGEKAREIISRIQSQEICAVTSCLAIDEVFWILQKNRSRAFALEVCRTLLSSRIRFLEVNKETIHISLGVIEEFSLRPRDAIHVATMKLHRVEHLVSEDSDFDVIPWIRRRGLLRSRK